MRLKKIISLYSVLLCLVIIFSGCESRQAGTAEVAWQYDYDAAVAAATNSNKPLFIVFSASWCPPCKQMKKYTFSKQSVKEYLEEHFIPVYVDTDKNPQLANQFGANAIPTYLILKPDQPNQITFGGFYDVDEFLRRLESGLASLNSRT